MLNQFKIIKTFFLFTLILSFSSCGTQPEMPQIPGIKGPFFNIQNGAILISMQLETYSIPAGARFPIPKLDNSFIEVSPAQFNGSFFQVSLDLKDIENGDFRFVDPQTLPGGRPLPGIIGGELPSLAVNIPDLFDTTFYVNKEIFGFFLPIPQLQIQAIATYRIVIDGKHLGNISLVGNDQFGEHSGVLLLCNLKAAENSGLRKLLKESRKAKNHNKIY